VKRGANRAVAVTVSLIVAGLGVPRTATATPAADSAPQIVTPVQAGDALAAATTEAAARVALSDIFTGSGIAVEDGSGAPAEEALVVVPTWTLDGMAKAHIDGKNITVAQNAKIYDTLFRWAGASPITPDAFSAMLASWFQSPADEQEQFLLDAMDELGKQTVPAYDIAAGAPTDAPLPLLILLAESIALQPPGSGTAGASTGKGIVISPRRRALANPCEIIGSAKSGHDKLTGFYMGLDKAGAAYNPQTWEQIEMNLDLIESDGAAAAEAGAEEAAAAVAAVVALVNGVLQFALAQGYMDVKMVQDPRPVPKHERGDPPNKTTVTLTVTSKSDTPKELADCLKLSNGNVSVDLPTAGKPIAKAQVRLSTGAHFDEHLSIDYSDGRAGGGFNKVTDKDGKLALPFETLPQRAPKDQGKQETREGTIHVEVAIQALGISPSQIIAAIFDHISPWSNDFAVTVTQREVVARTIHGSAKVDAVFLGLQVDLDLKACHGFDGFFTGTVGLAGGFQGGFAAAATALTGLPANGSALPSVSVHVPEQDRGNYIDDPGRPEHGVVSPLLGKLGILFVDDHTAEVTVDGTPLADFATGKIFTFPVTEGADGCVGS
jgi:hypothetical protein